MERQLDEAAIKRLEYYRKFKGNFVTVIKKDGFTVAGISSSDGLPIWDRFRLEKIGKIFKESDNYTG